MTHTAHHLENRGILARLARGIIACFEAPNLHLSRRDQIDALQAKSDAELARIGVKRDQIAYHVYHDLFYA